MFLTTGNGVSIHLNFVNLTDFTGIIDKTIISPKINRQGGCSNYRNFVKNRVGGWVVDP